MLRTTEKDLVATWSRANDIRNKARSPARGSPGSPVRKRGQAPACYLCGEDLGKGVSLKEHFEVCEGRPTMEARPRIRVENQTTGHIDQDYEMIKAINYPHRVVE